VGLVRRRRKSILSSMAVLVVGAGGLVWWQQGRVEGYRPGGEVEGLTDSLAAERPSGSPLIRLLDVGAEAGLDFQHFPGTRAGKLPEDMGSGVACGDVNGDGWTDLFLVNNGPAAGGGARSRLYLNRGNGTFEDATEASGIDLVAQGQAAAMVDVDGDGDLDLFVTTYGTPRLFDNDGSGRFRDVSARAGLDAFEGFWTGIGVADYDLDGAMDLYVCGYVQYDDSLANTGTARQFGLDIPAAINPSTFPPQRNLLLRGRGDGTFEEVAVAAGVDDPQGKGLGALFCDLSGDGLPDLYVANDVSDNALLINLGDGTFEDRTVACRVGDYRGAMGLAAADIDGDLDLDLFITHWVGQENALYEARQRPDNGERIYMDVADRHGLGHAGLRQVSWATRFLDLDGDGVLDLFVVNGSTIPRSEEVSQLTPMASQLFWRDPADSRFHELGASAGPFWEELHVGRGGASLDYDLDGDDDLLICLHGEGVRLLRNEGEGARRFLRLRLRQESGNTHAVGARVEIEHGGRRFLEVVGTQGSYLSQHTVGELTLGLGDDPWLESVQVTWPDGEVEQAGPFMAGSLVTWVRGARPTIEALTGAAEAAAAGPSAVEDQRGFFRVRDKASRFRVQGDLVAAVDAYREALGLWPGHADALYYLGGSLLGLGREAEALSAFETLVALQPGNSGGWMMLGRLRMPGGDLTLDDLDLARAAFEHCHDLNREQSGPVEALGMAALLAGELDTARGYMDDAAQLNPRSVRARYLAGRCAFLDGDLEGAARRLAEAHTLATDSVGDAGTSISNEGATAQGGAMLAATQVAQGPLERWRTLASRPLSTAAEEYGPD
jgi:enediyne biosynthesis protein E4